MSELVEQVARALEPLVDQRPAIDASASHIRSLQAKALACAALSVLEPLREALLWCSRHAGGEIADDASLAELKYVPEVVRLRIEALERDLAEARQARDFYAGRYAERCGGVLAERGWQPIETAPKATDEFGIGPWLLLFVPEGLDAPNMVTIGTYFREEQRDDQGRFLGGEWTAVDADMIRSAYIKPTHWRPLPPPPTGERGE